MLTPGSPGDDLGPYRIRRQLGRGGQATVYLAEDTRLHRQVALKVLDPGFTSHPTVFQRFRREAEITSRLDHPRICTVYETGEDRGLLWIAMRYVEGESLAKKLSTAKEGVASGATTGFLRLEEKGSPDAAARELSPAESRTGPKTWGEIARILSFFEEAARALHVAHEAGVVHRDIKPGNMIVTAEGEPVILDFGLAQEIEGDHPALTVTGDIMGTPAYMSPEQIAIPRIPLDRRTDVYSLGVSLFECLTLRRPFEAPTRLGLYQAIMTKEPPDLYKLNPSVPADLRVVVATAIAHNRDRRYQTALDLAEELRRVRVREPIVARPARAFTRLWRWSQRNPAIATALVMVGLVAGLVPALLTVIAHRNQIQVALTAITVERNAKQAALADYERLSDLVRLHNLVADADALWPAEPSKARAMRTWMDQAVDLGSHLSLHKEALDRLEASQASRPAPNDDRATEQFKHDTTAKLVADLTALLDPDPRKGLLADMGQRLQFAESVQQLTIGNYDRRWAEAIRSIGECPTYRGLTFSPQLGLVPIGADPRSGLWEFVDLATATNHQLVLPERRTDGTLEMARTSGLIFVLVPAGTFWMGSQAVDPKAPNFDPESTPAESPSHQVTLDPFFLSKFEMTQAQWQWITGTNPSIFTEAPVGQSQVEPFGSNHPVEGVSWTECVKALAPLGLDLPTEEQWEYACRAGTSTPWATGEEAGSLQGAANLSDTSVGNVFRSGQRLDSIDDGFAYHAPVGLFLPNAFGLHDMHGNVSEWCRDRLSQGDFVGGYLTRPGSGATDHNAGTATPLRVFRGGSFLNMPRDLRSAYRGRFTPNDHNGTIGVRPARPLRLAGGAAESR